MSSFFPIFFQFLFYLSAGTSLFLPLVNSQLTGAAHSKLIAMISCLLSFIACLGLGVAKIDFTIFSSTTLLHSLLWAVIWNRHQDKRTLEIYLYYVLSIVASFVFIHQSAMNWSIQLYIINSVLILGLINYIMILGHYYLVVPRLTVRPLILGIKIYWVLVFLKIVLLAPFHDVLNFWSNFIGLFMDQSQMLGPSRDMAELTLIFFQQLSFFIANPILSYLGYRLCLIRSTQSATGIFYVMVFFALISEMLSLYFLMTKGLRF